MSPDVSSPPIQAHSTVPHKSNIEASHSVAGSGPQAPAAEEAQDEDEAEIAFWTSATPLQRGEQEEATIAFQQNFLSRCLQAPASPPPLAIDKEAGEQAEAKIAHPKLGTLDSAKTASVQNHDPLLPSLQRPATSPQFPIANQDAHSTSSAECTVLLPGTGPPAGKRQRSIDEEWLPLPGTRAAVYRAMKQRISGTTDADHVSVLRNHLLQAPATPLHDIKQEDSDGDAGALFSMSSTMLPQDALAFGISQPTTEEEEWLPLPGTRAAAYWVQHSANK